MLKELQDSEQVQRFSKPPLSATRPPLRSGNPYDFYGFPSMAEPTDRPIRHINTSPPDTKTDTAGTAHRHPGSGAVLGLGIMATSALTMIAAAFLAAYTLWHARHAQACVRPTVFPPTWFGECGSKGNTLVHNKGE